VLGWPLSYGPLITMYDAGVIDLTTLVTIEATLYAPWGVLYDKVPLARAFGDWYIALWR
jgi:hypothetical protein